MAVPFKKPHLRIKGFSEGQTYKYPTTVVVKFGKKNRNRSVHGNRLLSKLKGIKEKFNILQSTKLPTEGLLRDDIIYVQFYTSWNFSFDFDQFTDNRSFDYQLLNIQKEVNNDQQIRYKVLVLLKEGGISKFIKKIEDYIDPEKDLESGNPKNERLLCNIEEIQLATLEAFWTDAQFHKFPDKQEEVWWEVWFRKSAENEIKVIEQLTTVGAKVGESKLEFTENIVRLVKATAEQLSNSLMFLDNLAELRKPQEMNDFITHQSVSYQDKKEWLQGLIDRTDVTTDENSVLICLLDSGVNNSHSLLEPLIPDSNLYAWKDTWGNYDTEPNGGHGTGMAGLALYGDLTEALATNDRIQIYYGIESFKVKHPQSFADKDLYGVIYKDACYTPLIDKPNNLRVYCLSVTNKDFVFYGRPSSSSASVDSIVFGNSIENEDPKLFIVSGGNVNLNKLVEYPDKNFIESVEDPGQAYNALTVGSYTRKNKLLNSNESIANYGAMSPSNSTSAAWENQWPNKPDVVFEGGNLEIDGDDLIHNDLLHPLSIDSEFPKYLFLPFGGTSSAAALGAKMAAELRTRYPEYWAETIRGLIVHSAEWTEAMLEGRNFINSESDRRAILRSVGYGVPNLEKAITSANNSLTLIAEETIIPYRKEKSTIKYNEYHLFTLPWPKDILLHEVAEKDVRITVTLSYFIDPNPGSRQYSRSFSYHSHELDFKLIKPLETIDEFKRRISAAAEGIEEDDEQPNLKTEDWTIRERIRSKGSIKKDFLDTSGAELSDRFYLAVYPKNGWYRTRKKLEKFGDSVRYSLIVSIETKQLDTDIYTPVENLIKVPIATFS